MSIHVQPAPDSRPAGPPLLLCAALLAGALGGVVLCLYPPAALLCWAAAGLCYVAWRLT